MKVKQLWRARAMGVLPAPSVGFRMARVALIAAWCWCFVVACPLASAAAITQAEAASVGKESGAAEPTHNEQPASSDQPASSSWFAGFAKRDITPQEPLRLSGYATRNDPHTAVADPLHVRVMLLSEAAEVTSQSVVLVSVDSIAVTEELTAAVAQWLRDRYGLARAQLVISSTHSHAAPHLAGGLENLFRQVPDAAQRAATRRYTDSVRTAIERCISEAAGNLARCRVSIGTGECDFAVQRRVIRDGSWAGFGVDAEGPVDHRVRVLRVSTPEGDLLGAAFMYACHCTTLGPDFNQVSADWAGLAASRLEQIHPAAICVPVIGCGADANPNPRGTYDLAQQHAAELVDAVEATLKRDDLQMLKRFPQARFGYVGLVPEQPGADVIEQRLASDNANEQRWAERMRAIQAEMGRLPESVPMPIHTWQFGEALSWVFLGGEVVVDYQFQIEKELETTETWVAAYCDDVFAYVASEAMRAPGGYEVDFSMIYYLQPGRWESGTQAKIVSRVREIWASDRSAGVSLSADQSYRSLHLADGFVADQVVAEPLVVDPINVAFARDGRVWVVEMNDYPLATRGGGRVKWLRDLDGDGRLDEARVFADQLSFPTSVMPWQDGAIIIAAPDVIWARDTDQDGVADRREVLLSGLAEANPQHRASGFEVGLDGWLHMGVGHGTRTIVSHRNGETYQVNGQDIAWNPSTGAVRVTGGETQYVPARDAYGRWFGNSNSLPMYQFVIDQRYYRGKSLPGGNVQHLLRPAVAPPVRPVSRSVDRFNDLFAEQRFTSACSSIVARVPGMQPDAAEPVAAEEGTALICEPVHNLVARFALRANGSALRASRMPEDDRHDFLAAEDSWMRPVRAINGPDGGIWIVDMSRRVIEHPEWIPKAWQQRVDLRGGAEQGRIYRVRHQNYPRNTLPVFRWDEDAVREMITSSNGVVRDWVAVGLIEQGGTPGMRQVILQAWRQAERADVAVSCLGALCAGGWLETEVLCEGVQHPDPRVVRFALELVPPHAAAMANDGAPRKTLGPELERALRDVVDRELGAMVDLQWVLTASMLPSHNWSDGVAKVARRSGEDPWVSKALTLVRGEQTAAVVLASLLERVDVRPQRDGIVGAVLPVETVLPLWKTLPPEKQAAWVQERISAWESEAITLRDSDVLLLRLFGKHPAGVIESLGELQFESLSTGLAERIPRLFTEPDVPPETRQRALQLIGAGVFDAKWELEWLDELLGDETEEVVLAAIAACDRVGTPVALKRLVQRWPEFTESQRKRAGSVLINHRSGVLGLLTGLERGVVVRRDLDQVTIDGLRHYRDRVVRSRVIAILGEPGDREEVVRRYLSEMPNPAGRQVAAGQQHFQQHCAACHRPGEATPVGPSLDNLGHWTNQQWVSAILNPSEVVEPKYCKTTILLEDGRVLAGIVEREHEGLLQIAESDGQRRSVEANEVADRKLSSLSLMPEGFEEQLSPRQVAELIAFLRSGAER